MVSIAHDDQRGNSLAKEQRGMSTFIPNSYQTPNDYVDQFMAFLTPEEWKVLSYIVRRTLGFNKRQDKISLSQLTDGLAVDGQQLDYGTGLHKKTVIEALKSLVEFKLISLISSGKPNHEAACYELQLESTNVDYEKLQQRAEETHSRIAKRTEKARAAALDKKKQQREERFQPAGLSHRPQDSLSDRPEDRSIQQTATGLSNRPKPVYPIDAQYPVENQIEKQRESPIVADATPDQEKTNQSDPIPQPKKKTDLLFEAFVEACGWSLDLLTEKQRMRINVALKKLRAVRQPTPDHVAAFVKWFTKEDWRGKKGERPTPELIVEFWDTGSTYRSPLEKAKQEMDDYYRCMEEARERKQGEATSRYYRCYMKARHAYEELRHGASV